MTDAHQIEQRYNDRIGQVLDSYERAKSEIRADVGATDGERSDKAFDAHGRYSPEYEAAIAERNARFEAREAEINSELFGAPVGSSSGTVAFNASLNKALDADEEKLKEYAETAALTGDEYLGRAVLAVAAQRGVLARALPYVNSNAEVLALFRELQSIPDAAAREKAAGSSLPMPSLEVLKPDARSVMDAEGAEAVRRYNRRLPG